MSSREPRLDQGGCTSPEGSAYPARGHQRVGEEQARGDGHRHRHRQHGEGGAPLAITAAIAKPAILTPRFFKIVPTPTGDEALAWRPSLGGDTRPKARAPFDRSRPRPRSTSRSL